MAVDDNGKAWLSVQHFLIAARDSIGCYRGRLVPNVLWASPLPLTPGEFPETNSHIHETSFGETRMHSVMRVVAVICGWARTQAYVVYTRN